MLLYHPDSNRNRDFINVYLNATISHSLEEFKQYQGDKFFMITVYDIWFINSLRKDNETTIDWEQVFPIEVIDELTKNNYYILVEHSSECWLKLAFDILDEFCKHINTPHTDVYICLANSQSVEVNINAYPNVKDYNFFSIERFEFDAVQFGHSMGSSMFNFKFKDRKRFLFLNRRYSVERAYLYFKFRELNLLDNIHCTFRLDNVNGNSKIELSDVANDIDRLYDDKDNVEYIENNIDFITNSLPHTIKTDTPLYNINYKTDYIYTFWNMAAHNSTDINIITETFKHHHVSTIAPILELDNITASEIHYDTFFFITEKTYRTILMKQPFILFSNARALKYLRKSGYKTFAPYINEAYDDIENFVDRQKAIVDEVKRLNSMELDEFNELLVKCREIATHNYDVLMTREANKYHNTVWSNEVIKPYMKEIDKKISSMSLIDWHRQPLL